MVLWDCATLVVYKKRSLIIDDYIDVDKGSSDTNDIIIIIERFIDSVENDGRLCAPSWNNKTNK